MTIHSSGQTIHGFTHLECMILSAEVAGIASAICLDGIGEVGSSEVSFSTWYSKFIFN